MKHGLGALSVVLLLMAGLAATVLLAGCGKKGNSQGPSQAPAATSAATTAAASSDSAAETEAKTKPAPETAPDKSRTFGRTDSSKEALEAGEYADVDEGGAAPLTAGPLPDSPARTLTGLRFSSSGMMMHPSYSIRKVPEGFECAITYDPIYWPAMDGKDGMDGLEAMEAIRSSGKTLPIYLASAYDWSDIEEKAKECGVSGFIGKPLFRSTLYERLSPLLGIEAKTLEKEDRYEDIGGMHILIAEDNDLNFEIIESLLGMYDITVERAQNGKIAFEMIENAKPNQFDLVFMDIQMPEMNGLDATKAIRALNSEYARTIPIIAMTADAFSENVSACFAAGMDGHIAKPVDIKLVVKEIRRIKERKDK